MIPGFAEFKIIPLFSEAKLLSATFGAHNTKPGLASDIRTYVGRCPPPGWIRKLWSDWGGRNLTVGPRVSEGPESTLSGHSDPRRRTAGPDPLRPKVTRSSDLVTGRGSRSAPAASRSPHTQPSPRGAPVQREHLRPVLAGRTGPARRRRAGRFRDAHAGFVGLAGLTQTVGPPACGSRRYQARRCR